MINSINYYVWCFELKKVTLNIIFWECNIIKNLFDDVTKEYKYDSGFEKYNVFLEIDIPGSKINKLPLPSYLGIEETSSISMTVESFV